MALPNGGSVSPNFWARHMVGENGPGSILPLYRANSVLGVATHAAKKGQTVTVQFPLTYAVRGKGDPAVHARALDRPTHTECGFPDDNKRVIYDPARRMYKVMIRKGRSLLRGPIDYRHKKRLMSALDGTTTRELWVYGVTCKNCLRRIKYQTGG